IGAICRGIASRVARGKTDHVTATPDLVAAMLGPAKYVRETKLKTSKPGVVTGLAYTPAGGEVLHIEATRYPGKGNVTLTGPIGGLKEKSLAAMRAGISTVIIPKLNEKDLVDVPEEAKQKLKFVPVENVDEALAVALEKSGAPESLQPNGQGKD